MKRNIVISGWPGAGVSALTFILAYKLDYKLLRGTETFRELGRRLDKENTGNDRIEIDEYLEPFFGPVFDKYIDYKLMNDNSLIVEADIGAFRLGLQDEFYSIFLKATRQERMKRLKTDDRDDDVDFLVQREESLRQTYLDLHNVDWFNLNEIKEKYNLVLDNTEKNIAEELKIIFNDLSKARVISEDKSEYLKTQAEEISNTFWKRGKEFFIKYLKENNKIADADQVLKEIKLIFPKEVKKFPKKLRSVL